MVKGMTYSNAITQQENGRYPLSKLTRSYAIILEGFYFLICLDITFFPYLILELSPTLVILLISDSWPS